VSEVLLRRARARDERAFRELTDPYRRELQLHCYRIVGSVQDAEDLVQETLLAAWRGLDRFEERSSVRTWLYRIATNRSLNNLRDRSRRIPEMPVPPEPPGAPPRPTRSIDSVWLQPYPDALIEGAIDPAPGPEARYDAREAIAVAFVAGLQRLPPRQRAALVLRDVLGFTGPEVAEILETSEASVNSALQRARNALDGDLAGADRGRTPLPNSPDERAVVGRFVEAFERGDIAGVVALLTDDALLRMPPEPIEYEGPAAIGAFLSSVPAGGDLERFRLVHTRANGQPAVACYLRDPHAPVARAYGLMVLTLSEDRVAGITGFPDASVFPAFGLPRTLPAEPR
jgi:RNA polymerase sigma-70 factor (TIGR02960 family)